MSTRAQQARYRAKARQSGKLKRYGAKPKSQFERGIFVAVDGEGFNQGDEYMRIVGTDNKEYKTRNHEYALLKASDGSEIYNPDGRLTTKQCLDFLLDIKINEPNAILTCFSSGYDVTHMLAFGLSRDELIELTRGDGSPYTRKIVDVTLSDPETGMSHDYRIESRPRKSLSVWRWKHGAAKYYKHDKKKGGYVWKMTDHHSIVLWDVWGFFQSSFVDAMKNWLPNDADHEFIKSNKGNRNIFDRSEIDTIRKYCDSELRCLVSIMERVRDAIASLGLEISRWDGAGAIAGAMFKLFDVKSHMQESPPEVFNAARIAYSGGHIETYKLGYHNGAIHHYDINSAYPHWFRVLPSLRHGTWKHATNMLPDQLCSLSEFSLVRVEYRFLPGLPFYPLFYRQSNGSIIYPERGAGWYWKPEFDAAQEFCRKFGFIEFRVKEAWSLTTPVNERPFGWIEDAYAQRQEIIAASNLSGIPNGAEKMIKLGINSCYGKSAQQVGARYKDGEIVLPSYFQIEWAGFVTAGCRSQLMQAAMRNPPAIVALATDGIYSTEPLDLYAPAKKELGAWEYKIHAGITMVMPGVYWIHDTPTKMNKSGLTNYSRGFDKGAMRDTDFVHEGWKRKKDRIEVASHRLITLGSSLMSNDFWEMRGCFVDTTRSLQLNGDNSKRHCINYNKHRPEKGLVSTIPIDLLEDYDMPLEHLMSEPYPVSWMDLDNPETSEISAAITNADRSYYVDALSARDA